MVTAQLENVEYFAPKLENFRWCIKLKCSSCQQETEGYVYFTAEDSVSIPGSRGTANLVKKCDLCKKSYNISVVDKSIKKYQNDEKNKYQQIAAFEIRGAEPVGYESPMEDWLALSSLSSKIYDVEFDDNVWVGLDEKTGSVISISDFDSHFTIIK